MRLIQTTRSDIGFSAVELMISIAVLGMFLGSFLTLYASIIQFGSSTRQRTNAGSYSNEYLGKFISDPAQERATTTCNSTTDLVTNPSAMGKVLGTDMGGDSRFLLPPPIIVQAIAYYPMGCSSSTPVLKVVVTVTWGPGNMQVQQGAYVN
jgi:Tfp pilus assembly protein PilV